MIEAERAYIGEEMGIRDAFELYMKGGVKYLKLVDAMIFTKMGIIIQPQYKSNTELSVCFKQIVSGKKGSEMYSNEIIISNTSDYQIIHQWLDSIVSKLISPFPKKWLCGAIKLNPNFVIKSVQTNQKRPTTDEFTIKQKIMPDKVLVSHAKEILADICFSGKGFHYSVPPQITDGDMIIGELIQRFEQVMGKSSLSSPYAKQRHKRLSIATAIINATTCLGGHPESGSVVELTDKILEIFYGDGYLKQQTNEG